MSTTSVPCQVTRPFVVNPPDPRQPGIPRPSLECKLQAAEAAVVAERTMIETTIVARQVVGLIEGSTLPAPVARLWQLTRPWRRRA